ncbi:MAG: hypothetical protein CML04_06650 [Pseudozobellia sp.]|nr:hypothetical protein [Pseudozobellia sp.]MBG49902.1 hypothetical protein [Pseudozobellia sp.]MBG50025.1 hypothetical protein [Pseudozobellia sp.]|tara:strand:+ start:1078 stop:2379 length:1302 start_codon:yes stop_codon:yes gene_type:complete
MIRKLFLLLLVISALSCKEKKVSTFSIPSPKKQSYEVSSTTLNDDQYYDKVLGALVGSAIGDAMGASTEMWHRDDIRLKYGYITALTPAVRPQSPEGTWENNLNSGATTDDTRWKLAMVKYISKGKENLTPENFIDFIIEYYSSLTKSLSNNNEGLNTDFLDEQIEKIDWIKEWARVATAYKKGSKEYQKALHRFYGGEMSCAGQLYTPMFGLTTHTPEEAYELAYDHSLFDIGYAKDISALVSAMTNVAMRTQSIDSIINTATFVDPEGYQDSRLVGRIAYSVADASVKSVLSIRETFANDSLTTMDAKSLNPPIGFQEGKKEWLIQEALYQYLEKDQKAIPFHSGEIWQILVTGLQFGGGDFAKTMQFIVNYGRDNDTVAAVAGMILGAKTGFSNLPKKLVAEILKVNKENMGIDLKALAQEMTENRNQIN